MSDQIVDIKFLVPTTIDVTADGLEFEEEVYEEGDVEQEVTIIAEESDNMVTLQYGDGSIGTVDRAAFEIIYEYN